MNTTSTSSTLNMDKLTSALWKDREEYIMFRIAKRVTELTETLTQKGRPPLKMSIGAPTVAPPKEVTEVLKIYLDDPELNTYSVPRGEPFFREAVAKRMKNRFGVTVDAGKEVCSLIGSKEGLAQMFRGLITPKLDVKQQDIILTPDPGYASYADAIHGAGGLSFPTPLTLENRYLPDFDAVLADLKAQGLEASNIKALIINYPSNPIGATAPFAFYEEAVLFCQKLGIALISDVAYSEMYFAGEEAPHSILEVPGAKHLAIEFHSLSKPYAMTGWRIGFAVGNAELVALLANVKSTADSGIFKALQKTAAFALNSPECDTYIQNVNKIYEENQALTLKGFEKLGWPIAELNPPRATFYLWLPIPPRYTSCEIFTKELLETSGIVAVPGTAFGPSGEGFIRLSLVLPKAQLQEVIDRMETDGFRYL